MKICAIKLKTKTSNLFVLSLYRAPPGDFNQFLWGFDVTLKYQFNSKTEFVICPNISIGYLITIEYVSGFSNHVKKLRRSKTGT